jgi:hypothetical protein
VCLVPSSSLLEQVLNPSGGEEEEEKRDRDKCIPVYVLGNKYQQSHSIEM